MLHSYSVIDNSQLKMITATDDPSICRVNLRYLRFWMSFIDVECDDECLEEISTANGHRSLRLFYQLFLVLESKDRLHFVTQRSKRDNFIPSSKKFTVTAVEEDTPCVCIKTHRLAKPLINYCDKAIIGERNKLFDNCKNEKSHREKFQKRVLSEIWDKMVEADDDEFDEHLMEKLTRQSLYERKMTSELCEIRNYRAAIVDNRRLIEEETRSAMKKDEMLNDVFRQNDRLHVISKVKRECRRLCQLKEKIEKEKARVLGEKHYKLCRAIVDDIVILTIKAAEFEASNRMPIPRNILNEWKSLFIAEQPLTFDDPSDIEEIFDLKLEEHAVMSNFDFERYKDLDAPWEEFVPETSDEERQFLELGITVLGYVVHKLLYALYPPSSGISESQVPKVKNAVVVYGLPEEIKQSQALQQLLAKSNIKLIKVEDAVNYCLSKFKEEMKDYKHIDLICYSKPETSVGTTKKYPAKARNKSKGEGDGSKAVKSGEDKETQTPRNIPYDDISPMLSDPAYIGQWAHEFLSFDQPISDELSVKVLIEYLKSLKEVDGWVLIDFPTNYNQMQRLEFALNGCRVPSESELNNGSSMESVNINDFVQDSVSRITCFECDIYADDSEVYRQSMLLPNPFKSTQEPVVSSTTFFTSFIRLIPNLQPDKYDDLDLYQVLPEDTTSLDTYYVNQDIAYVIYYNKFDQSTLKRLARLIIGDISLTQQPSEMLFDEHLLVKLQSSNNNSQVSFSENDEFIEDESTLTIKPGDRNWQWVDLPQDPTELETLGVLWENIERVYIEDLKDTFLIKRINLLSVFPYKNFIEKMTKKFIGRPDDRQELVTKFQIEYNGIDLDMRDDDEVKAELHCRVHDFQENLSNLSDQRRSVAEQERQRLINDNWTHYEAVILLNIYIALIQVEIDRTVDTFQLVQDYYWLMLKYPLTGVVQKVLLEKVPLSSASLPKTNRSKSVAKVAPPVSNGETVKQEIANLLLSGSSDDFTDCSKMYCYKVVQDNVQHATSLVSGLAKALNDNIAKETREGNSSTANYDLLEEWRFAVMYEISRVRLQLRVLESAALADLNFLIGTIHKTFNEIRESIDERYLRELNSINELSTVVKHAIEHCVPIQPELVLEGDSFSVNPDVLMYPDPPFSMTCSVRESEVMSSTRFKMVQLGRLMDIFRRVAPSGTMPTLSLVYILQDIIVCHEQADMSQLLPANWYNLNPKQVGSLVELMFGNDAYADWRDFIVQLMELPVPTQQQLLELKYQFREIDIDTTWTIQKDKIKYIHFWFLPMPLYSSAVSDHDTEAILHNNYEAQEEDIYEMEANMRNPQMIRDLKLPNCICSLNEDSDLSRLMLAKELLCQMFLASSEAICYPELLLALCKDDEPREGLAKAFAIAMDALICSDYEEGERKVDELIEQKRYNETEEAKRSQLREEAAKVFK